MFDQGIQLFFGDWLTAFSSPHKRIFWGYLLSAFFLALWWLILVKKLSPIAALGQIFSANSWFGKSARTDYLLMMLNGVVMGLLSPKLLGKAAVATILFSWLHEIFNGRVLLGANISGPVVAITFTLFLFVFDDFTRYWLHRWLHTMPALWSFHKVHHSATNLNPFTVFRTHPVEAVLFSIRGALVQGISVAIFIYFFGDKVTLVTVLGAGLFNFIFNALGANLRHSPVAIGFWKPAERVFISPAQHQIHHSHGPEHIDKNFGVVFAFWDLWFGSHCYSEKDQKLSYGLSGQQEYQNHDLKSLYLAPFQEVGLYAINMIKVMLNKQPVYSISKGH